MKLNTTHISVANEIFHPNNPLGKYEWITTLCNDSMNYVIPISKAELKVRRNTSRYYITKDGNSEDLVLVEYLTTAPDEDKENNLSSLPEIMPTD